MRTRRMQTFDLGNKEQAAQYYSLLKKIMAGRLKFEILAKGKIRTLIPRGAFARKIDRELNVILTQTEQIAKDLKFVRSFFGHTS